MHADVSTQEKKKKDDLMGSYHTQETVGFLFTIQFQSNSFSNSVEICYAYLLVTARPLFHLC